MLNESPGNCKIYLHFSVKMELWLNSKYRVQLCMLCRNNQIDKTFVFF